jgi:hypothetical protein
VTLHGFSAQGVSNAIAYEEQGVRTGEVGIDAQNAAVADEHGRALVLGRREGRHGDALAVLLCRICEWLGKIWACVQDVWMLREESEEQAKRMLLPLLTLHRTFWSPGCYANTPSTWQQTHMRLACEYRYVRFLHLRM